MLLHSDLKIADTVAAALAAGRPVVALESTIIAHGFPFPANVDLARELESAVKSAGAVPATIAIVNGVAHCGLSEVDLERLASDATFTKCAARDVPVALATGANAATTVSATCLIAASVGIEVFATGGIGGVHRGAEATWDESADLAALSRWPVAVVSAGAKAILDLPKTLERLETLSVPVVGYATDELPAFYSRTSGCRLTCRCDDVSSLAAIWRRQRAFGGMLIANPIQADDEIPQALVEVWIAEALKKAQKDGVSGRSLTPFLLAEIAARSDGASVTANRALALQNARLAGLFAAALATLPSP